MRAFLVTLVLLGSGVFPAMAQWYVGFELGLTSYHGSSRDTSSSHVIDEGGPAGGIAVGIGLTRHWHRLGATVRVSYARSGFAVTGNDVTLVDRTTGRRAELATLISTRVGGIGPSGAVRVDLGPSLHLWDFDGETHVRGAAIAACSYEWTVSSRLVGAIRFEGMLSPSWFDATDVPPEFERRVTWRYGVGLGLRYRL